MLISILIHGYLCTFGFPWIFRMAVQEEEEAAYWVGISKGRARAS